jgi:hypothetical protein
MMAVRLVCGESHRIVGREPDDEGKVLDTWSATTRRSKWRRSRNGGENSARRVCAERKPIGSTSSARCGPRWRWAPILRASGCALAARWQELVQVFTGGDPEIDRSLQRMWAQEENIHGYDTAAMRQLGKYLAPAAAIAPNAR